MRIAYIAAGAGAMYCGACARDATLARGLRARGHDVQIVPLYTPLKIETDDLPTSPVFCGGINVFLQQASALFRHLPAPVARFLDRPAFLRAVARFAIDVEPRKLGPMTVSMLAGSHGRQQQEIARLLHYLETTFRPELVNLTNSLISGIAPELKRRLNIPVVCTFQGEDGFVADLPEPHRSRALELIRANARSIDLFICPSEALAPTVAEFLAIPRERLCVIRTAVAPAEPVKPPATPFTVGYLSVIRPPKGLDILVEALAILRRQKSDIRLLIAGRIMHRRFWKQINAIIRRNSLQEYVEYVGEVDGPGKAAFFQRCHAFCLPSRYAEPRGVAVMEAMAAGLPPVVPNTGVYPEILADAGIMVPPENPAALAQAIAELQADPARTAMRAAKARDFVLQNCSPDQMAGQTLAQYARLLPAS